MDRSSFVGFVLGLGHRVREWAGDKFPQDGYRGWYCLRRLVGCSDYGGDREVDGETSPFDCRRQEERGGEGDEGYYKIDIHLCISLYGPQPSSSLPPHLFGQKERGTAKGTSFREISIHLELSSDDLADERVARNWSECVSIESVSR